MGSYMSFLCICFFPNRGSASCVSELDAGNLELLTTLYSLGLLVPWEGVPLQPQEQKTKRHQARCGGPI